MFRFSTLLLHRPNFIKLTTTMAVMAIVAAMVLPIVNDHAKRGHRARARAALLHAALWMERMATAQGRYPVAAAKDYDPVGELYYEAFRYLQGQQPTSQATAGLIGVPASDRSLAENFPAYRVWKDPFAGFQDNVGKGRSCLRNSVLTVADVFTHSDRYLPGNTQAIHQDAIRDADTSPVPLDVQSWTNIVGSFEANQGLDYTDSNGKPQKANNIQPNQPYRTDLANIATDTFGATGATGSFMMAGLAHFANTQSFRADFPKAQPGNLGLCTAGRKRRDR